jgi:hypothetical protein
MLHLLGCGQETSLLAAEVFSYTHIHEALSSPTCLYLSTNFFQYYGGDMRVPWIFLMGY